MVGRVVINGTHHYKSSSSKEWIAISRRRNQLSGGFYTLTSPPRDAHWCCQQKRSLASEVPPSTVLTIRARFPPASCDSYLRPRPLSVNSSAGPSNATARLVNGVELCWKQLIDVVISRGVRFLRGPVADWWSTGRSDDHSSLLEIPMKSGTPRQAESIRLF